MRLNGQEHTELIEAITEAFPSYNKLKQMFRTQFDQPLNVIAERNGLGDVLFKLVEWAESKGKLEELITKAHEYNPDAPKLNSFYEKRKQITAPDQVMKTAEDSEELEESQRKENLPMNDSILTILHISDTRISASQTRNLRIMKKHLFKDLQNLRSKLGLKPNIVIFAGDLVNDGEISYSEPNSDYYTAKHEFIDSLLDELELSTDYFFICPGDFDIQKSAIDDVLEMGIESSFTSTASMNQFVDNFENKEHYFARMKNFEIFKKVVASNFALTDTSLFSTYCFVLAGKKIGVACVNSAWRASQDQRDSGNLLVGARVIDKCIDDLIDCDLKAIVIHHSLKYLKEFEREDIQRRIFDTFDFVLHGYESGNAIVEVYNNRSVDIMSGALDQNKDIYRGYSVIQCLGEDFGNVFLREYSGRGKGFSENSVYEAGKVSFNLIKSENDINIDISLISQIRDSLYAFADGRLMLPLADSSIAPRNLNKLFVIPPLATESEYKKASCKFDQQKEMTTTLSEILRSAQNILFIGKKESGKTSLLNHICTEYAELRDFIQFRFPIFINFVEDLPARGRDKIRKAIDNYQVSFGLKKSSLNEYLTMGNCAIIIDDVKLDDGRNLKALVEFVQTYPKNRYMFAVDENLLAEAEFDVPSNLGCDYKKVYIHSFGRNQIKELINKWFQGTLNPLEASKILETIMDNITDTYLPATPLLITLILIITEQSPGYLVINKSSLVEKLIEILLEKVNLSGKGAGGIDYRTKENFLSQVASQMASQNCYKLDIVKFEEQIREYFRNKGWDQQQGTQDLIDYFVNSGILAQHENQIYFRFDCFCEFFIAKHMAENETFYEQIIAEDVYLAYSSEIGYLTGLQRTNRELIELIDQRTGDALKKLLEQISFEVNIKLFDEIQLNVDILESIPEANDNREGIIAKIKEDKIGEERKERILNEITLPFHKQSLNRKNYDDYKELVYENLLLLATVVKNCELIDDKQFKKDKVRNCISYFLKLAYLTLIQSESNATEHDDIGVLKKMLEFGLDFESNKIDNEELSVLEKYFAKILPFILFHSIISHVLGTTKLAMILREEIKDTENYPALQLMYALMYFDLALSDSIEEIQKICKNTNSKYYLEILWLKLQAAYSWQVFKTRELKQLENLLADIFLSRKNLSRQHKNKVIQMIRSSPRG